MCNVHICHCFTPWLNSSNVGEINILLDYALSLVSFGPLSKRRKRHEHKTAGRQTLADEMHLTQQTKGREGLLSV